MKKLGSIAFALSVSLASPSFAVSTASASLSDFTVSLFDLDPSDPYAPVVTWRVAPGAPGGSEIFGLASTLDPAGPSTFNLFGPQPFSDLQATAGGTVALASAAIRSGRAGRVDGGSALAFGWARALTGVPVPQDGYSYFAQALPTSSTDFVLSPHTRAVFSGLGRAFASTSVGAVARNGFIFGEFAMAQVEMRVEGPGPGGEGDQQDLALAAADASFRQSTVFDPASRQYKTVFRPESFADNRRLAVSFTNSSGQELGGSLLLNIFASGNSSVPAIPEPAGFAMLLAGLGLMGGMARRGGRRP